MTLHENGSPTRTVSIVSDPESGQELAESHLMMLKNNCLCFKMSSSFVGNNPSLALQIHSFNFSELEDRGKCNLNKTGNPSISDFSTILTSASDILILADSSHLPSDEAYRQCLSHFNHDRACIGFFKQLLSKSEKRFVRTHWLQASRRSCE